MSGRSRREAYHRACELVAADVAPVMVSDKGVDKTLARLADCGTRNNGCLTFDAADLRILAKWLTDHGIDPTAYLASDGRSARTRTEAAAVMGDEKAGAPAIAQSHGLVALALGGTQSPTLNGQSLAAPPGTSFVVQTSATDTLSADWIMAVENYESFLQLASEPMRPSRAGAGVFVLRGSTSFPKGMPWARWQAQSQGITFAHAPDLDPAGLSALLASEADYGWLPDLSALDRPALIKSPELFFRQHRSMQALTDTARTGAPGLMPWIQWLMTHESAVTQESAFASGLPFCWAPLHRPARGSARAPSTA